MYFAPCCQGIPPVVWTSGTVAAQVSSQSYTVLTILGLLKVIIIQQQKSVKNTKKWLKYKGESTDIAADSEHEGESDGRA